MDYRLFYAKESASDGVRVILEEIGVPYELIQSTKDRSKPRPLEQLEINPNGWVPVLMYGGNGIYECAAITIFLCDLHPEANLAPNFYEPKRGLYLQTLWCTFPTLYKLLSKLTIIQIVLPIQLLMNRVPKNEA